MCGRFSLTKQEEAINQRFRTNGSIAPYIPRFNGAPSQPLAVISNQLPGMISHFRWGLVPFWAKDPAIGYKLINAKSETLSEKPSFKNSFKQKRCLVLSDGFFEWKKDNEKTPYFISLKDQQLFAMAGLWDTWSDTEGKQMNTFTIITTEPNDMMKSIHNRMPVILRPDYETEWLENDNTSDLQKLLSPYPSKEMQNWKVSKLVNSTKNETPEIFKRLEAEQGSLF